MVKLVSFAVPEMPGPDTLGFETPEPKRCPARMEFSLRAPPMASPMDAAGPERETPDSDEV
jgi:hypothetical protein